MARLLRHACLAVVASWVALPAIGASIAPFSTAPVGDPPPPWTLVTLPRIPRHTRYAIVAREGTHVLRVEADHSYGNLMHRFTHDEEPGVSTPFLQWRWRVEAMNMRTDITRRSGDDVPARVCVLFDLPLERLHSEDRFAVSMGRAAFDPDLPAATICYVWDSHLAPGTWLPNAFVARVMQLVLQRAPTREWKEERRDLRLDFAAAFPYESANGAFPGIAAVGVSADGDNTGARSLAFLGDVSLSAE
jgi:hypothetical protein